MATERYSVKIDAPWQEPSDLPAPTAEQWSGGVVVNMLENVTGLDQTFLKREYVLMDAISAAAAVEVLEARYATEREIKCAAAVGLKWPSKPGVKAPAPAKGKSKSKGKAKAPEAPAESEPWEG